MGEKRVITKQKWEMDQAVVLQSIALEIDRELATNGGHPLVLTLSKKERGRTNAQNNFMWPMLRAIGKAAGEDDEKIVKEEMLTAWVGERYEVVMGRKRQIYPKTSKFTKKQMVNFIEFLKAHAANVYGITPPVHPEYEAYAAEVR